MADNTNPTHNDAVEGITTTGAGTTTGTGQNTVGGTASGGPLTGGLGGNAVTSGNASQGAATAAAIETDDAAQNVDQLPGDGATQTGSMTTDTVALGGGAASVGSADGEAGPDIDGGSR
jgi:hypothetical protein